MAAPPASGEMARVGQGAQAGRGAGEGRARQVLHVPLLLDYMREEGDWVECDADAAGACV